MFRSLSRRLFHSGRVGVLQLSNADPRHIRSLRRSRLGHQNVRVELARRRRPAVLNCPGDLTGRPVLRSRRCHRVPAVGRYQGAELGQVAGSVGSLRTRSAPCQKTVVSSGPECPVLAHHCQVLVAPEEKFGWSGAAEGGQSLVACSC